MGYKKKYEDCYGKIPDGNEIHHLDHDRKNNDLSNLVAIDKALHQKYHKLYMYADLIYHPTNLLEQGKGQYCASIDFDAHMVREVLAYLQVKAKVHAIKQGIELDIDFSNKVKVINGFS